MDEYTLFLIGNILLVVLGALIGYTSDKVVKDDKPLGISLFFLAFGLIGLGVFSLAQIAIDATLS